MAIITSSTTYFDFRKALTKKKLAGMLRMMTDYRLAYMYGEPDPGYFCPGKDGYLPAPAKLR